MELSILNLSLSKNPVSITQQLFSPLTPAHLYEGLPRVGGNHGLQLPGGEGVHVTRLRGHQQHHLGPRQGGKLVCLKILQMLNLRWLAEMK